ncbi:AHH domain-containing protein, partial [Archangium sp.]|uniref:AHH domain-containing protein n=1 Tax=Archangium sp. TaxID=1872627 RepID=UPI00389AD5E7
LRGCVVGGFPEPVSKGLAALFTATAIAYLGVDTVWRIIDGWVQLVRDVDRAVTFNALRAAGEKYGKVLGASAARVFVMLVTAAIGNTTGLAAKVQGLPGSAQAALAAETEAGFTYSAVEGVQSVAMSAEGFTIVLAPHVLAMSARGTRDGGHVDKHHLATIANEKSTARGGPWTPKFRELFKKAGMELKDPENIVSVEGHRGPHPEEYHQRIFNRLDRTMSGCRTVVQCRDFLKATLDELAREVSTPGTRLNQLVTGTAGR